MAEIRVNQYGVLLVDFRYQNKRHVLSTGLKNSKQNYRLVSLKRQAIEYDIKINNLDIGRYFPQFKIAETRSIPTLADYFEYYKKEKSIRDGSLSNLNWAWEDYIKPHFGQWKLSDIVRHEILVFRNKISEKLAGSSTNLVMTHLAGILTRAHQEGKIALYPMHKIGKLDSNTEQIDPFSFDELKNLLDFLYSGNYPEADMIFIWSRIGCRHGEILTLKWSDLDYFKAQLNISRTMTNNGAEGPPKTKKSRRTLPMRPAVIEAYKRQEMRSRMVGDYIFPDPVTKERYKAPVIFWRRFKNILKLAGIKYRSPNQLRHTFATLHIAAGENITWVSKMLGHESVSTTLQRYNKYIPNLTRDDGSAYESQFEKVMKCPGIETENEPGRNQNG
jgi:integrase